MERLKIDREIIFVGMSRRPKPFYPGEHLSGVFPHKGPGDAKHKGNLRVTETDGNFDDSGLAGDTGKAECVLPGCKVAVEIVVKFEK